MKTTLQKLPFFFVIMLTVYLCVLFLYNNAKEIIYSSPGGDTSLTRIDKTRTPDLDSGCAGLQPESEIWTLHWVFGSAWPTTAYVAPTCMSFAGEQNSPPASPAPSATQDTTSFWRTIDRENNHTGSLQYYCGDNVDISDGRIVITSKKETRGHKEYTSGRVESTECFLYGSYNFKIRVSTGAGLFSAIWMMPANGKQMPEIDIFEMIGRKPNYFYGVLHYMGAKGQEREYFYVKVSTKEFYDVGIEWGKKELRWYIDGKCLMTVKRGVPEDYMYLIINQAVGSTWAGVPDKNTKFPSTFVIESYDIRPESRRAR